MKLSTVFDGLMLLILIFLLTISADYPFQLKLLPWIFIPLAIILLAVQIVMDLRNEAAGIPLAEWVDAVKHGNRRYLKAVLWILGLFGFLYLAGFIAAAPVFTILFLRSNGETWRQAAGLSILGWGIFFIVFIYALNVRLYEGQIYLIFFS